LGKSGFSADAKRLVRETGFETAVTTIWGLNEPMMIFPAEKV